MGHINIFAPPTHLRVASEEMAKIIRYSEFDALFLDLSQQLDGLIKNLTEGAPYDSFLERVRELALVPEPLSSWEYEVEPILLAVRGIMNRKPELEIWCYKKPDFAQLSAEIAENVARLVLRVCMTEKIDLDEWRHLITRFLEASADALNEEAKYIAERSAGKETSLCISRINGRTLKDRLSEYGLNTRLTYPFLPYHFTPMEILTREMKSELKGSIMNGNMILQLIKAHIDFVREYVLTSRNYDEAYFQWVYDKAAWIKFRKLLLNIPKNGINLR